MSDATDVMERLKDGYAEVNGIRLHYVEAGSGPLVLLLHGFPEYSNSWHRQIPALVQAGYHVVAPEMRGYNLSDKPSSWRDYDASALGADIAALVRHFDVERAHIVGHDWGAAVAYLTAMEHPEVVERVAILNAPHPARMLTGFRTLKQLRKSWYMFFFQLPVAPERLLAANNYRALKRALAESPHGFSNEDIAGYVETWKRPGALKGMLDYYRAALRQTPGKALARMSPIAAPVLVIWGERDSVLGRELAMPEPEWVPNAHVEYLPDATHWVQHDAPERVNELLVEFLGSAAD